MQPAARYAHHRHFIPDLAKGTLVGKPVNEGRGPMSGTEWASILDRAARCFRRACYFRVRLVTLVEMLVVEASI